MNRKIKVTRQQLAGWLGLPLDAELSLGLPCGAPVEGEEGVVLRVGTDAAPAVPGRLAEAEALLRSLEWIDDGERHGRCCPLCGQSQNEGHWKCGDSGCRLGAFLAPQPEPSASLGESGDAGTLPSQHLPAEEERDPDVRPTWDERGLPLCDDVCPNFDGKRCKATGFRPDRFCEPELIRLSALAGQVEGMEQKSAPSPSASPVSAAPTKGRVCKYCGWKSVLTKPCIKCGRPAGAAVPTKKEEPAT